MVDWAYCSDTARDVMILIGRRRLSGRAGKAIYIDPLAITVVPITIRDT